MLDPKDILKAAQIKLSAKDPDWLKRGRQAMELHTLETDPKKAN